MSNPGSLFEWDARARFKRAQAPTLSSPPRGVMRKRRPKFKPRSLVERGRTEGATGVCVGASENDGEEENAGVQAARMRAEGRRREWGREKERKGFGLSLA